MSLLRRLGFLALVATLVAPLAGAARVDRWAEDWESGCDDTCTLTVMHYVGSDSADGDCVGRPGAYTACGVYHYCESLGSGILATVTTYCHSDLSGGAAESCTSGILHTACYAITAEYVVVPAGTCAWFYGEGFLTSPTGSMHILLLPLRVCVNANGPY